MEGVSSTEKRGSVVIGICGASNGGKTTLADELLQRHAWATVIHQDDFYKEGDQVPTTADGGKLWDEVEAIDVEKLVKAVRVATSPQAGASGRGTECDSQGDSGLHEHLVIVEGTMLLSMRELRPLLDAAYFITLDHDTMQTRRSEREYSEPLAADYFEYRVWPSYMRDMKVACSAHQDDTVRMLDGTQEILYNLREIMTSSEKIFNVSFLTH